MAAPTVREICTLALRKPGVVGTGLSASAEDLDNAFTILRGLYERWVQEGKFGAVKDVLISASYTAEENERVVVNTDAAVTVTLPTTVNDPILGETRPPQDLSIVIVAEAGSQPQISIYDANLAAWTRLDSLTLNSAAPLALRGRDGLASVLAVAFAEEYGGQIGAMTLQAASSFVSGLSMNRMGRGRPEVEFF